MSTYSSSGEVFGAKVLYGAMVILSVLLLLASIASPPPQTVAANAGASVEHVAETVVVTAKSGKVS